MKLRVLLAGALLIAAAATPAFAAGPYVSVAGGLSIIHDSDVSVTDVDGQKYNADLSYDTGMGVAVGVGYNFDKFRLEGEFAYRNVDVDKLSAYGYSFDMGGTEMTVKSYMINGYYDIKTSSPVTPFLGVGLGMINGEFEASGEKEDDTVAGYQLTAGVSFAANKNVNLDIYYRLQGAFSDFEKYDTEISYLSSNIFAGVRFNF